MKKIKEEKVPTSKAILTEKKFKIRNNEIKASIG